MPNIGSALTIPSLTKGWGTNVSVPFSNYSGSICLVSLIEIDDGWSWLQKLKNMYDDADANFGYAPLKPNVKIVAILFNYGGTLTRATVSGKISTDPVLSTLGDNSNFLVLVNPNWAAGNPAYDCSGDFSGALASGTSDFYWSYAMGRTGAVSGNQNAIADKWEFRSATLGTAFSKIILESGGQIVTAIDEGTGVFTLSPPPATPLAFDSKLERNCRAFVIQRFKNLVDPPRVLSMDPPDQSWVNDPADLAAVKLWFSKPMHQGDASSAGRYSITGGGLGAPPLAISGSPTYNLLSNALNEAGLSLAGTITDANADKTIVIAGSNVRDSYGVSPTPAVPMIVAYTYRIDVTPPAVILSDLHPDSIVRDADTVDITATFTEANGIVETPKPKITIGSLVSGADMTKSTNAVWTYSWNVPAGDYPSVNVSIDAQDPAGNPAAAPTGKTSYTIDNTAPGAPGTPAKSLGGGYINAVEAAAGVGIEVGLGSSGAVAGDTVELLLGGASFAPAQSKVWSGLGLCAFTVPGASFGADGTKVITARVTDIAGNLGSESAGLSLVLDTVAPTIATFATPSYCGASDGKATVTIQASDATSGVASYEITGDISPATGIVAWNGAAATVDIYLTTAADGDKNLTLTVRDFAGNPKAGGPQKVVLDRAAPVVVAFTTPSYCAASDGKIGVTIQASDVTSGVASYEITGDLSLATGVVAWDGSSKTFDVYLTTAADGNKNLTLRVLDKAGNAKTQGPQMVILDRAAPTIVAFTTPTYCNASDGKASITIQASDSTSGVASYEITGDLSPATGLVSWDGSPKTFDIYVTTAADGDKNLTLTVKDKAGNAKSQGPQKVVLDTVAPTIVAFTTPSYCTAADGKTSVTIRASDATSLVASYEITGDLSPATGVVAWDGTSKTFDIYLTTAADGDKNLTLTVKDKAGNTKTQGPQKVVLDTAAPTIVAFTTPSYCTAADGKTSLTIQANDATSLVASYEITGDLSPATGVVAWDGTLKTFDIYLTTTADGDKNLILTVKDNAGNTKTQGPQKVVLDTAAPTIVAFTTPSYCTAADGKTSVTIQASDATSLVASYEITGDLSPATGVVAWDGTLKTFDIYLTTAADGDKNLTLIVKDNAGNTKSQGPQKVVLDRVAPTILQFVTPVFCTAIDGKIGVTIEASDATSLVGSYEITGDLSPATGVVAWDGILITFDIYLTTAADGAKNLSLIVRDKAGNSTSVGPRKVTLDRAGPTIVPSSCKVTSTNEFLHIVFSEGVYTSPGASTALAYGDFSIATTNGAATFHLVPTISHGAGETMATFTIVIDSGTPDGTETIVVTPNGANQIFDAAGNAAPAATSSGPIYLHKPEPCFISNVCLFDIKCRPLIWCGRTVFCKPRIHCALPNICLRPVDCKFAILKCPPKVVIPPDCSGPRVIPDCLEILGNIPGGGCPGYYDPAPFERITDLLRDAVRDGGLGGFDEALASPEISKLKASLPKEALKPFFVMLAAIRKELVQAGGRRGE